MSLTFSTITSQFSSIATLNANFSLVSDWSNSVLLKTGGTMQGPLDMNGQSILNLSAPVNPTDPVRLMDLETGGLDINAIVPSQSGNANKFLYTDGTSVSWQVAPGSPGAGISSITFTDGLSGGTITTIGTVGIANTGVSAGSYGAANTVPTFTVNSRGQLTAAGSATISITKSQVSDLGTIGTMAAQNVTSYVPKSGGAYDGDLTRTGRGPFVHHNAALPSGRIFIQPSGPPPTMANGDILLEW